MDTTFLCCLLVDNFYKKGEPQPEQLYYYIIYWMLIFEQFSLAK